METKAALKTVSTGVKCSIIYLIIEKATLSQLLTYRGFLTRMVYLKHDI